LQKLQKYGNKYPRNFFQKSRNKSKQIREQNPGTKILKIQEQKLQKSGNKNYKN
jgi:hypothetical protein